MRADRQLGHAARLCAAVAAAALMLAASACDECSGVPSCVGSGEVSYTGHFIERRSGRPVAGVAVDFVRSSGVELAVATPHAVSDGDGFFVLRAPALQAGFVTGDLHVRPPAPLQDYTISDVTLKVNRIRGDGGDLGRIVVDPYLFMIGHVYDRVTGAPLADVRVTARRVSGGRVEPDHATFTTDAGGQFSWDPRLVDAQAVDVEFEMDKDGFARPYTVLRTVDFVYRDAEFAFELLPVGWGLAYSGGTTRRGSNEVMPETRIGYTWLSGIPTQPADTTFVPDVNGSFIVAVTPLAEGALTARIRVIPPPRFPPETTVVTMHTSDDDRYVTLGYLRYGAQVYLSTHLRDALTALPIAEGTRVQVERLSGPALDWTTPPADSGIVTVGANGALSVQAPTVDAGSMLLRLVVRLSSTMQWDTLSVPVAARFSDSAVVVAPLAVRQRPKP